MKKLYVLIFMLAVSTVNPLLTVSQASASGIDWQAGNIMSDAVFTNKTSMTTAQIQDFLNSKVPTCDTNGQQNSEFGGPDINGDGRVQRWEWGQSRYNQTTFPCLKDYVVSDGRRSAQVIYDVAQKYSINPQVLIVLLQKEQGIVTDTWPLNVQYRTATGYGCPDTAPCDAQYYGLVNQLDWAAKMFRAILNDSPTWYTPYELGNNYVQYSPDSNCGGSVINIQNRATQALYNYTPYQPNQATLNAGWGTATCGAYGNRNFYLYFTNWFGPTTSSEILSSSLVMASPISITPSTPRVGEPVTVSFNIRNATSNTINYGSNLAQCRNEKFTNCDSAYSSGASIAPGATRALSYTIIPKSSGEMTIKPFFANENGVWHRYGASQSGDLSEMTIRVPHLRATSPMTTNYKHPNVGEVMRFSVPIINNGNQPITISTSLIQCRLNGVTNCDSPFGGSDTISPGQTKTYSYSIPINQSGDYTFTAYYRFDNRWYKYIFLDTPMSVYATDITANNTFSLNESSPITGQPLYVNYTLSNNSSRGVNIDSTITQCRFNVNTNCDASFRDATTLAQGESRSYSDSFKSNIPGSYRFTPYYRINGEYHIPRTAPSLNTNVSEYTADMRVTSFSNSPPPAGGQFDVSYTVRNFGSKTAYYTNGVLQCRKDTTVNCDPSYYGLVAVAPGESRSFTDRISSSTLSGTYTLRPYFFQNNKWHTYKNIDGSQHQPINVRVNRIEPSLSISGGMSLTSDSLSVGSTQTVRYTVMNNGTTTTSVSKWVTQCRVNGFNCDAPSGANGASFVIAPGNSIELTSNHGIDRAGNHTLVPYFYYDGAWFKYTGNPSKSFTAY